MDTTSDSSTCHILSLPNELLAAIASELHIQRGFLQDPESEKRRLRSNDITIRCLCSLALTCKRFNAVITPLLYRCIIRSPKKHFASSLFRTLINNPKLGQHVRYLEFEELDDFTPREWLASLKTNFTDSNCQKFDELWHRAQQLTWSPESTGLVLPIGTAKEPALYAAISNCNFAVLASVMDNLQEVAVPMMQDVLLWLVFRHTSQHDKLKRLWLRSETIVDKPLDSESKCKFPVVISCTEGHIPFYLHRIIDTLPPPKSLVQDGWPRLGPSVEDRPLARMEELNLRLYNADLDWIDQHIRGCATLKRFSCVWYGDHDYVPQGRLNLPRLRKSLTHVENSLTHLTIDPSGYIWHAYDSDQCIIQIESLRGFSALTYLKIDGLTLWGDGWWEVPRLSTILPPSLVTLVLETEWDNRVQDALYELVDDCATFLPNLKKLDCTNILADEEAAKELQDLFEAEGVDLCIEWKRAETDSEDDRNSDDSLDAEDDSESEAEETLLETPHIHMPTSASGIVAIVILPDHFFP
jgi:hypothetical protein